MLFSCTSAYHTTGVTPINPAPNQQVYPVQNQEGRSYQVFYDELSAYGKWIDYPVEGYVWSPNVDQNFQPYGTNGQWVYTDQGWTWASNYPWGWATFHYGRWFYEDGYGWLWVPGHEWAPAWVTWGHSGNYYGWAPLGPNVEANQQWTPPQNSWTFVPQERLSETNVGQYAEDRNIANIVKNTTIINNTTTIINKTVVNNNVVNNTVNNNINNSRVNNTNETNNRVNNTNVTNNNVTNNTNNKIIVNNNLSNNHILINKGPELSEVQKVTPVPITRATIVENSKPAQTTKVNNTLVVYRPAIEENNVQDTANKPRPKKVVPFKKNNVKE